MVIQNDDILIRVDPLGAEWRSFIDKRTGSELLWQGDPAYWAGQAPVLFPVIGSQVDGCIRVDGVSYPHPKHGFIRRRMTTPIRHVSDELAFELASDAESKTHYPFDFRFRVGFRIDGPMVENWFEVENAGSAPMPYHLGAHPAFNITVGKTRIRFDEPETASVHGVAPDGLLLAQPKPYLANCQEIEVREDTFIPDALVFKNLASRGLHVIRYDGGTSLRVTFDDFPYLGIWAKPGAPYVCIEPWIGCADTVGTRLDFRDKEAVRIVQPGGTHRAAYRVYLGMIDGFQLARKVTVPRSRISPIRTCTPVTVESR